MSDEQIWRASCSGPCNGERGYCSTPMACRIPEPEPLGWRVAHIVGPAIFVGMAAGWALGWWL
jgi:hypothetical protein